MTGPATTATNTSYSFRAPKAVCDSPSRGMMGISTVSSTPYGFPTAAALTSACLQNGSARLDDGRTYTSKPSRTDAFPRTTETHAPTYLTKRCTLDWTAREEEFRRNRATE